MPRQGFASWMAHGATFERAGTTGTTRSPARHWGMYLWAQAAAGLLAATVTAVLGSIGFGTISDQIRSHDKTTEVWFYIAPWAAVFATLIAARVVTTWARGQYRFHQSLWLATIARDLHAEFDIELADLNRALVMVPLLKHPKSPYLLRDRLTLPLGAPTTIRIQVPPLAGEMLSILIQEPGSEVWVQPKPRHGSQPGEPAQ